VLDLADPLSLSRLLLYGQPETRRSIADGLAQSGRPDDWAMLAATVRSNESWLLRARCLELLGMAAADAGEDTAKSIIAALWDLAASG
jgi:hypothetical protein